MPSGDRPSRKSRPLRPGKERRQRASTVPTARRWARIINGIGWATAAWLLFYPRPLVLAVLVTLSVPIWALLSMRYFPGVLKFEPKKGGPDPAIMTAFLIPTAAMCLAGFWAFEILDWRAFWAPFTAFTVGIYGLLLYCAEDVRAKVSLMIPVFLFCAGYGLGVTLTLNSALDRSAPVTYEAQVLGKRVSSGRRRSYYLELSPWGPRTETAESSVSKSFYQQRSEGDAVRVTLKQGALGIPWFVVR